MNAETRGRVFFVGAIVLAVGALLAGWTVLDSPAKERARRIDRHRVEDLTGISNSVERVFIKTGTLPSTLEAAAGGDAGLKRTDPVTRTSYEYRVTSVNTFELCATFDVSSEPPRYSGHEDSWRHPAGRHCFTREMKRPAKQQRP